MDTMMGACICKLRLRASGYLRSSQFTDLQQQQLNAHVFSQQEQAARDKPPSLQFQTSHVEDTPPGQTTRRGDLTAEHSWSYL